MNPVIKVVGVGGSGGNTISRIVSLGETRRGAAKSGGVELIAVNTDAQALHFCKVEKKILIGQHVTRGLGAGMDLELGKVAAQENKKELEEVLKGTDMVFITCGLGGGTGSGATPVIAEIAKGLGILTIVVVTAPFSFEGEQRKKVADAALQNLKGHTDALLIISNDNLLKIINEKTTVSNAFEICDDILKQAVKSITDLIMLPGIINIDFASISALMKNSGKALFGTGVASGEGRAIEAAKKAISSPLLDFSIKGAKGVLISVFGADISLNEIKESSKIITENVDKKAQIAFGAVKDNSLKKGEIKINVIVTNF